MHSDDRASTETPEGASDPFDRVVLVWRGGPDGVRLEFAAGWCDVTGRTAAELLSDGWLELVNPADRAACRASIERFARDHERAVLRYRLRAADGTEREVTDEIVPLRDGSGRCFASMGAATIAQVRDGASGRTPRRSITRMRRVERPDDAVEWGIDADGNTVSVDDSIARMLGYDAVEMLAQPLVNFVTPAQQLSAARVLARRRAANAERHEYEFRRKDRSTLWVELSATPLLDGEGRFEGALVRVRDITAIRAARTELRTTERCFEMMLESIADAVLTVDRNGCVVRMNPAAQRATGWSKSSSRGRHLDEVFRYVEEATGQRCALGSDVLVRARRLRGTLIARDGAELSIVGELWPVHDERGEPQSALLVVRDQTELRVADAARRRAQEEFRRAIDALHDAVMIRAGQRYVYVNPALVAMLGYDRADDVLALPPDKLFHASVGCPPPLETLDSTQQRSEWRLRGKDGGEVRIEFGPPVPLEFEGAVAMLRVGRDMVERRLFDTRVMLEERLSAVGTMAVGVAHEINNPLAYLLAGADFAARELPELIGSLVSADSTAGASADGGLESVAARLREVSQAIADVRDGAERVRHIVEHLKTFARASDDTVGVVNLHRVLEATLAIGGGEFGRTARVVKEFAPVPDVRANESRLAKAFLNLLLNAAQSIPPGFAHENAIRVVTATDERGWACVDVIDTGCGIEPEHLGRIFDPFFTTRGLGPDLGLGLSMTRAIVLSYGGEIRVESVVGRGSRFRVCLAPAPTQVEPPRPSVPPREPRRKTVLVVDDEPLVLASLRRALGKLHDVHVEKSPLAALARFDRGERFDVVLCDVMMPEANGMEVYARVRAIDRSQAERFVFVTAGAFTHAAREFLAGIPNARLEKPFDLHQLRALVADAERVV